MTYIDCEECDGEGYLEYQLRNERFRIFACKCNKRIWFGIGKMTRTTRDKKKAADGQPWRDCGEKHCPWCEDNRQNVKIKAKLFIKDDVKLN